KPKNAGSVIRYLLIKHYKQSVELSSSQKGHSSPALIHKTPTSRKRSRYKLSQNLKMVIDHISNQTERQTKCDIDRFRHLI
ncbi:hypothetical protein OFC87_26995, partial [Escherichia coli]|nr:hypothetical protein [Escherichia coli]